MQSLGPGGVQRAAGRCIRETFAVQAPPTDLNRPVRLSEGLFVCGDHRDSATLDGALRSGRRAAEAILATSRASRSRTQQLVAAKA